MPEEPQSELHSDKSAKKGPEKLPKPVLEKPAKPTLERPSKTATKTAHTDSFTKQGSEKSRKSPPPPPPPRKTFASSSSGMTTTRSGEVVFTSRKDSVSAQVGVIGGCIFKCVYTAAMKDNRYWLFFTNLTILTGEWRGHSTFPSPNQDHQGSTRDQAEASHASTRHCFCHWRRGGWRGQDYGRAPG